jgi:hypothetical protein
MVQKTLRQVTPRNKVLSISASPRAGAGSTWARLAILAAALVLALAFAATGRAESLTTESSSVVAPEPCDGLTCTSTQDTSAGDGLGTADSGTESGSTADSGTESGSTPDADGTTAPSSDEATPQASDEVVPPPESSPGEVEPPTAIPDGEPEAPPVGTETGIPVTDPVSDPPPSTGVDSPEPLPSHVPPQPAPLPDVYPGSGAAPAFNDVLASLSLLASPPSNVTSPDMSAQSGGGAKGPGSSGDMPGKRGLPGGPSGPSAPSPTPAGAAGGSGGGFFFAGFAALVAAISFGVARRNSGRLTLSVASGHPVALVSLPERPG